MSLHVENTSRPSTRGNAFHADLSSSNWFVIVDQLEEGKNPQLEEPLIVNIIKLSQSNIHKLDAPRFQHIKASNLNNVCSQLGPSYGIKYLVKDRSLPRGVV